MASVQAFLERDTGPMPASLSRLETAKLIGGSYRVIGGLVAGGYLKVIKKPNWDHVSMDSIIAFEQSYRLLGRFCQRAGVPFITVRAIARKAKIPLIPVTTNQKPTLLVRQSDLQDLDVLVSTEKHVQEKRALVRKTACACG
jgi:hypothetical protein